MMLENQGISITSEYIDQSDEFPNQSTPKASVIEEPNDDQEAADANANRESHETVRDIGFANISVLNNPNASKSQEGGGGSSGDISQNQKEVVDNKQPTFNLADKYFKDKENKLEKQAAQIVINLEQSNFDI